jgi:hypothetical protein
VWEVLGSHGKSESRGESELALGAERPHEDLVEKENGGQGEGMGRVQREDKATARARIVA